MPTKNANNIIPKYIIEDFFASFTALFLGFIRIFHKLLPSPHKIIFQHHTVLFQVTDNKIMRN